MKDYKITKVFTRRNFTEAELGSTATGTALILDNAYFGYMAIIPKKDKQYPQMWLSEEAAIKAHAGMIVELSEAHILTVTAVAEYSDGRKEEWSEEIFLDF